MVDVSPSMHGDLPALSGLVTDYFNRVVRTHASTALAHGRCACRARAASHRAAHALCSPHLPAPGLDGAYSQQCAQPRVSSSPPACLLSPRCCLRSRV